MNFIMIYLFLLFSYCNVFSLLVEQLNNNHEKANNLKDKIKQMQEEENTLKKTINQKQLQEKINQENNLLYKANEKLSEYIKKHKQYKDFFSNYNKTTSQVKKKSHIIDFSAIINNNNYNNNYDSLYNENFNTLLQLQKTITQNSEKKFESLKPVEIDYEKKNNILEINFLDIQILYNSIKICNKLHEQIISEKQNFLQLIEKITNTVETSKLNFNFPNINHENNIKEIYEQYIKNELIFFQGLFSNDDNFNNILNNFNIKDKNIIDNINKIKETTKNLIITIIKNQNKENIASNTIFKRKIYKDALENNIKNAISSLSFFLLSNNKNQLQIFNQINPQLNINVLDTYIIDLDTINNKSLKYTLIDYLKMLSQEIPIYDCFKQEIEEEIQKKVTVFVKQDVDSIKNQSKIDPITIIEEIKNYNNLNEDGMKTELKNNKYLNNVYKNELESFHYLIDNDKLINEKIQKQISINIINNDNKISPQNKKIATQALENDQIQKKQSFFDWIYSSKYKYQEIITIINNSNQKTYENIIKEIISNKDIQKNYDFKKISTIIEADETLQKAMLQKILPFIIMKSKETSAEKIKEMLYSELEENFDSSIIKNFLLDFETKYEKLITTQIIKNFIENQIFFNQDEYEKIIKQQFPNITIDSNESKDIINKQIENNYNKINNEDQYFKQDKVITILKNNLIQKSEMIIERIDIKNKMKDVLKEYFETYNFDVSKLKIDIILKKESIQNIIDTVFNEKRISSILQYIKHNFDHKIHIIQAYKNNINTIVKNIIIAIIKNISYDIDHSITLDLNFNETTNNKINNLLKEKIDTWKKEINNLLENLKIHKNLNENIIKQQFNILNLFNNNDFQEIKNELINSINNYSKEKTINNIEIEFEKIKNNILSLDELKKSLKNNSFDDDVIDFFIIKNKEKIDTLISDNNIQKNINLKTAFKLYLEGKNTKLEKNYPGLKEIIEQNYFSDLEYLRNDTIKYIKNMNLEEDSIENKKKMIQLIQKNIDKNIESSYPLLYEFADKKDIINYIITEKTINTIIQNKIKEDFSLYNRAFTTKTKENFGKLGFFVLTSIGIYGVYRIGNYIYDRYKKKNTNIIQEQKENLKQL